MDVENLSFRQKLALKINNKIRNNEKELHTLSQLFWECTLRCNIACKHCGSDCKTASVAPDMPIADFMKVIDDITPHVDPHKCFIIFSGGEPLVRQDLEIAGAELFRRGFPWGMVSNGFALDEKRLHSLLRAGMHSITISLDGFEDDHNWMRGNKESFQRAVNAIKLIAQNSFLTWDIVTCVNKRNFKYLDEFKHFLLSIGVKNWRIFSIVPMGRAANYPEFQLSDDEYKAMLDYIVAEREKGEIGISYSCEGFLGSYEGKVRNHLYHCAAGVSIASVLIDGSVSACTSIRGKYYQGNIYKRSFWDIWENEFKPYRNRSWMKQQEPCKDCKMFTYCQGNGMHLRREDGSLMICHLERLKNAK